MPYGPQLTPFDQLRSRLTGPSWGQQLGGLGSLFSDIMHEAAANDAWQFGQRPPQSPAIDAGLHALIPNKMGMALGAVMGVPPEFPDSWPPPISGPPIVRTPGATRSTRALMQWTKGLHPAMAERGWDADIFGSGLRQTETGALNPQGWTNPYARPGAPAPVPGSGAEMGLPPAYRAGGGAIDELLFKARAISEAKSNVRNSHMSGPISDALANAYEAVHGPGSFVDPQMNAAQNSLDQAMAQARDKFQYPPTQYSVLAGQQSARSDLYEAGFGHDAMEARGSLPYHEWTTTTTDALAEHHGATPAELLDAWNRRGEGVDGVPFSTGIRRPGDPWFMTQPDMWKYLGNERWQRIGGLQKLGQNLSGLSDDVINQLSKKVWGKDPKGWKPERISGDQMGDILMNRNIPGSKAQDRVDWNQPSPAANISSGKWAGDWRAYVDQTGENHSWERVPKMPDVDNLMGEAFYNYTQNHGDWYEQWKDGKVDLNPPKVGHFDELGHPVDHSALPRDVRIDSQGNIWKLGAYDRWFRMSGPGMDVYGEGQ